MNLENLNVQEMNTEEQKNVDGGESVHNSGTNLGPSPLEDWWNLYLLALEM